YNSMLKFEKDGVKANPIQLKGLNNTEPEVAGRYLTDLYLKWKPPEGADEPELVGALYGFNLFIRQEKSAWEENGAYTYRYHNRFYAEGPESKIKYTWNGGEPNTENPKIAARHFLNAIDRVSALKEKYQKELKDMVKEVVMVEKIINKPFEKEEELEQMKAALSKMEREIALKIKAPDVSQLEPEKTLEEAMVANSLSDKIKATQVNELQQPLLRRGRKLGI
ncbi:MAG: hypothetical protein ACRDE2_14965, partial [Chitinophagaceae bacterium]